MVSLNDNYHTDKLDFYNAKARTVFINQASVECGVKTDVIKKDLGKILLKLESLQDELIQKTLTPEQETQIELNDNERQAALELLQDKDLLARILEDFNVAGVVGETTNKLCGYLACVSRKLDKPLAIMIQSSSAAGNDMVKFGGCEKSKVEQTDYRFSRKQIRDFTGWSDSQLKNHCKRLEEMEYLLVHRGGRGQLMEYELLYNGSIEDEYPQLMGLIDLEKLTCDAKKSGSKQSKSVPSLGQVCPKSTPSLTDENVVRTNGIKASSESKQRSNKNALIPKENNTIVRQHRTDNLTSLAAN